MENSSIRRARSPSRSRCPRPTSTGSNGFRIIDGGASVSGAGDVNGDGFADLIIGAPGSYGLPTSAGKSYVVFGGAGGFGGALDLGALDDSNGFRFGGAGSPLGYDYVFPPVSDAGDVNGDGVADVIEGSPVADPGDQYNAGSSFLVFGDPAGFVGGVFIDGVSPNNSVGFAVDGAGDVNGDGFADLIFGAPGAVLFGGNFTGAVDGLGGDGDDLFIGSGAGENFVGGRGDDALVGNGGPDLLNGAVGDDLLAIGDLGFRQLQGGTGFDTVRLDTAGASLDLTAVPESFVQGIEAFDLHGASNILVLDRLENPEHRRRLEHDHRVRRPDQRGLGSAAGRRHRRSDR
jgi:hypothetical protein